MKVSKTKLVAMAKREIAAGSTRFNLEFVHGEVASADLHAAAQEIVALGYVANVCDSPGGIVGIACAKRRETSEDDGFDKMLAEATAWAKAAAEKRHAQKKPSRHRGR
jgi:hypothetical protein